MRAKRVSARRSHETGDTIRYDTIRSTPVLPIGPAMVRIIGKQVQLKASGAPVVLDVASAGGEPAITIAKVLTTRVFLQWFVRVYRVLDSVSALLLLLFVVCVRGQFRDVMLHSFYFFVCPSASLFCFSCGGGGFNFESIDACALSHRPVVF